MNPSTKKRVIKNTRNSPKVPADFDSESEDQNGIHSKISSNSSRLPLSSYKAPRLRVHQKDTSGLWGLDTPSGTDSGICSSDRTVPWSPEQHPSKSKSTLIVAPAVDNETTSLVEHPLPSSEQQKWKLSVIFHILSFISSCLIMVILSYYFFINMTQFKMSLSSLSKEIHTSKVTPVNPLAYSDDSLPTIHKEISDLRKDLLILISKQQSMSQNLTDVQSSVNFPFDKLNITFENSLASLQSRILILEITDRSHDNQFIEFGKFLQQYNTSLVELDNRILNLNLMMEQFNSSLVSLSRPDVINTNLVDMAFARHYQDQIGMYDFALGSAGGRIVDELTSETYSGSEAIRAFGFTLFSLSNSPDVILEPTVLPGSCWPFSGSGGVIGIKVTHEILLQNVTIDHVPSELTDDGIRSSAPKDFLVRGLKSRDSKAIDLGDFTFKQDSTFPFQTFTIPNSSPKELFSLFQLEFKSNHGHSNLTCIYRVRLHGSISLN